MLIKQNQLLGEATAFLDTLYRLPLSENSYPAKMVNVHHVSRLGRDLIQLESFLKFGQENGVNDGGYAIHLICEANDVESVNFVDFVVNEESLFLNTSILETYCQLKNSNFNVYVNPISEYSPYRTVLKEALLFDDAYPDYASSYNLQRYVNESFADEAKSRLDKGVSKAKSVANSGAKEVSSKLASVRKEIAVKSAKLQTATGPAKVKLMQQINKLKDASKELRNKFHSVTSGIAHKAEGAANSVSTAVKNAQRSARQQFDSATDAIGKKIHGARNTVSNAIDSVTDRASKGISSAKDAVSGAVDNVSSAVGKHVNSAKDAVSNAANSIKSKFD